MTETPQSDGTPPSAPAAELHKRRGISMVWLIPVVAAVVGAGVAYETFSKKGPTVTFTLASGGGLEAGKTKVKYRDVEIGTVTEVVLSSDLESVVATAELEKETEDHLTEGTVFWKVSPRISLQGITGLGTLMSGQYIAMIPGPGKSARKFAVLDSPPLSSQHHDALAIELESETLGSIGSDSPVTFRGITVGQVAKYDFDDKSLKFRIHALIDRPYAHLVKTSTQFWNASGIDVSIGADGIDVSTASLTSLVEGGIEFATPAWGENAPAAETGAHFHLYTGRKSAERARERVEGLNIAVESRDGSISVGAPVFYRKHRVGHVGQSDLSADATSVRYQVHIDPHYAPLVRTNSRFWNASGVDVHVGMDGVDVRTDSLASIIEGGLEFATPDRLGAKAERGTLFAVYAEPEKEWLAWAPKVWLDAAAGEEAVAHVLPAASSKPAGLEILLESFTSGSVKAGDSIFFREVKVGVIGESELSADAKTVRIHAIIEPKYATLVRHNSRFWNASGISAHIGLGGVDVQTESLESIMAGGVAFATPDEPGNPVKRLTIFPMHPKAEDEWLTWSPTIWVDPARKGKPVEHSIREETHRHLFGGKEKDEAVSPDDGSDGSLAAPEASAEPADGKRPGFFRRLFGGGGD